MIVTKNKNKKGREKIKTSLLVRDRLRNQRRIERIIFRLRYAQPWGFVHTGQTGQVPSGNPVRHFICSTVRRWSRSARSGNRDSPCSRSGPSARHSDYPS